MRLAAITLLLVFGVSTLSVGETILIADKTANELLYFDTDTGQVTRSVPVGANPHEVAVTPNGRWAFTANSRSNTVSVIDLEAGSELKRLESPLFAYPHGLAVHPNGETVYLTSEQKKLLILIDADKLEIVGKVSTDREGSHMVVLSPRGDRAYISDRGSASVTVLETGDLGQIQHSPAGEGAEGIALSPDGRWLAVANRHDNDLHIFDAPSLGASGKIPVGEGPVRVAFSPDGQWVLISHRGSDQVHVVDFAGRKTKARLQVGKEPGGMVFLRDGTKAFVANTGEGTLSVLDIETLTVGETYPAGEGPDGMALVPVSDPGTLVKGQTRHWGGCDDAFTQLGCCDGCAGGSVCACGRRGQGK
jgi:YVTN family beta-propeller protein